jgi:enoyl-CoA hydratase/carnithine racemase
MTRCDVLASRAEIVLAAPPLNLLSHQVVEDLHAAVAAIPEEARAVVLRAEGKVFSAGVDVDDAFAGRTAEAGRRFFDRALALVQAVEAIPVPTIAVLHGLTLTLGLELALGCDFIWAGESASLGLVEATVGLTPAAGGTQRLVARAGRGRAAEIAYLGEIGSATQWHDYGVVDRLLPDQHLLEEARAFADRLAAGPTAAHRVGKDLLRAAQNEGIAATDRITADLAGALLETHDLQHGVRSLRENGPGKACFVGH